MKHIFLMLVLCVLSLPVLGQDETPILLGEMNPRSVFPSHVEEMRRGYKIAIEEVNEEGGVFARPLKLLTRDDQLDPATAVRLTEEYILRDEVFMLLGASADHVGLAVSEISKRQEVPFFKGWGGTDKHVWDKAHPYVFRHGNTASFLARFYADKAAEFPATRWAIVIPALEYGQSTFDLFKSRLMEKDGHAEIVSVIKYEVGNLKAAEVLQALRASQMEALFIMAWDADLLKLLRKGRSIGFWENKEVIADWIAGTTSLKFFGAETPQGWYSCGFPAEDTPDNPFYSYIQKYKKHYETIPDYIGVEGYTTIKLIVEGLRRAGKIDRKEFAKALRGATIETPYYGTLKVREIDGQVSQGCYFGRTDVQDGKGVFVDYDWIDAGSYFPPNEKIRELMKEGN